MASQTGNRSESTAAWMAQRWRDVERRGADAEQVARQLWDAATRSGHSLAAKKSAGLLDLGVQALRQTSSTPSVKAAVTSSAPKAASPSEDLSELRRQQARFHKTVAEIGRQNAWMAISALAPDAAVIALEAGPGLLGRGLAQGVNKPPLEFVEREPFRRVGDNWATRAGRRAHDALKQSLEQKPGRDYEPKVDQLTDKLMKPDAGAPVPDPMFPGRRFQLEYKPNTPTGRAAAARAVRRYQSGTGNRTRAIFYDPADYL